MTNPVRRPIAAESALILAAALFLPLAHAQAPGATVGLDSEQGISERAKKDAASPLYWIRLNAKSAAGAPAKPVPRKAADKPAVAAARPASHGAHANAAAGSSDATPAIVGPAPEVAAELAAPGAFAATSPPLTDEANEPLTLISGGEPEFPTGVMRRLRKGAVQVSFEVQLDGSVGNATVVQTPHDGLNAAALKAVSSWRFRPAGSVRSAVVDLGFDLDS